MELKDIIKSRRTELNLTQKEVADYVGVSEATISRWESGNIKNMGRDKIYKLSKILQVKGSVLTDDDGKKGFVLASDIFHHDEEIALNLPEIKPIITEEEADLLDCFNNAPSDIKEAVKRILAPYKQDTASAVG